MANRPDPFLGTVLDGRYRIRARIARGGMATVYRAEDTRLDRQVAIKIMHPHLADKEEFLRRFHREARAAARLSSPHVVAVHDEGTCEGGPFGETTYLVMEYVSGPDLRTELSRRGSFPVGLALSIISQILHGLSPAHEAGLVHRDVKPENVMLVGEKKAPTAKVTDFGLARAVAEASHTSTGTILGTVAYLAPEVMESAPSAAADIYAVGVMAYELIAGEVPFTADTPIALAYKHVNQAMPRLSTLAPWIPSSVDSLIGVLTAKDPSQRPQSAQDASRLVDQVIAELDEIVATRRVPVIPSIPRSDTPTDSPQPPRQETAVKSPTQTKQYEAAVLPRATTRQISKEQLASRPKKRIGLRLFLIFLLLALTGGGIYWYFTWGPGMRISMPNVAGQDREVAVAMIEDSGLRAEIEEEYSDDVEENKVISSDPEAPSDVPQDTVVTLTVSLGVEQVTVPDVSGQSEEEATASLTDARLTPLQEEEYSDTVPEGTVISQTPEAGIDIDHSSEVTIVVSLGREPVEAPDVTGSSQADATSALEDAGLYVEVTEEYSDDVPEGQVISQSTADQFYRGDTVTLTVSLGPELFEVPDVFGLQAAEARQILEDAGFTVEEERFLGGVFNTVREQSIAAGEMVPRGTTIKITVV